MHHSDHDDVGDSPPDERSIFARDGGRCLLCPSTDDVEVVQANNGGYLVSCRDCAELYGRDWRRGELTEEEKESYRRPQAQTLTIQDFLSPKGAPRVAAEKRRLEALVDPDRPTLPKYEAELRLKWHRQQIQEWHARNAGAVLIERHAHIPVRRPSSERPRGRRATCRARARSPGRRTAADDGDPEPEPLEPSGHPEGRS